MKAIVIDPFNQTITEHETPGQLHDIYELGDYDCLCTVRLNQEDDIVYLDDNGLFQNNQAFWKFKDYPQPLAGKGVVLGTDYAGYSVSPAVATVAWMQERVEWLDTAQVAAAADGGAFRSTVSTLNEDLTPGEVLSDETIEPAVVSQLKDAIPRIAKAIEQASREAFAEGMPPSTKDTLEYIIESTIKFLDEDDRELWNGLEFGHKVDVVVASIEFYLGKQ